MKIESIRDILSWTVQFHEKLASSLKHYQPSHSERARMAIQYLVVHEEHLASLVKASSDKAKFGELETMAIEYLDKNPIDLQEHSDANFDEKTESEIVTNVFEQHQKVIEFYTYLRDRATVSHHAELLDNLLKLEQQEIVLMAQGLNRFQDM